MTKILFVCHGNTCRSPMAEFMMKYYVSQRGESQKYQISSAATSTEEIGNDIYYQAKEMLRKNGIPFEKHYARQITRADYENNDIIICMDQNNLRNLDRLLNGDPKKKVRMLLDRPIADPWYYGNFESTYDDLKEGIELLITTLNKNEE